MTALPERLFSSVAIYVTGKCNIACAHCMPESGPQVRNRLETTRVLSWIAKLHDYGTSYVAFTGGEPFIVPELLAAVSDEAAHWGMTVSAMTNAFWARTVSSAESWLARFPAITRIGISTDRFHWEHIPVSFVQNAIEACRNTGRIVMVRAAYTESAVSEVDEVLERLGAHRQLLDCFEAQPVIRLGRAQATMVADEMFDMGAAIMTERCSVADTPTIDEMGDVYACCGPAMYAGKGPLYLGNIDAETVGSMASRAERNLALQTVRTLGPGRLFIAMKAEAERPEVRAPRHICDVCQACCRHDSTAQWGQLNRDAELADEVGRARLVLFGDASMLK